MAIDDSLERARLHPDVLKNLNKNKKLKMAEAYSEDNPPPYPVTSVNGHTGDVDIPTVDLPVSVQDGGTGANNAADARANLGLCDVATENVVPLNKGGTGASNAADARTNLAVLPLAGGTLTGQVTSSHPGIGIVTQHGTAGRDTGLQATRTDTGVSALFGVGSGGVNHGIYSYKLGKWLIYGDGSNVYCNGTATNVTGTVAIGHGGTGATTAAAARTNLGVPTLLDVYPVGSIYMSVNSTSPATLFGGTWEQLKDRFLLAAGSTYSAGGTGGRTAGSSAANTGAASNTDNMPPYLTVYMWKRTK